MHGARPSGRRGLALVAAVLAALVGVAAAAAAIHLGSGAVSVKLRKTGLGSVLVDARGRTLYMYTHDKRGTSACYGGCASAWPPLLSKTKTPTAAAGLRKTLLGTTKRKDGKLQITYARHPLYTFAFDKKAGQVTGQGYGSSWYVVAASGKVIRAAAKAPAATTPAATTPQTTTTTSSGGGGWG